MKFNKLILIIFIFYSFFTSNLRGQVIVPQKNNSDSISTLIIDGLKRTKSITIFRELNYEPNKKLFVNDSLLNRWELRLSSLNLFTDVEFIRNNDTLKITVIEEFYYWLNPVGGFADRNFHNWLLNPKANRLYFGGDFLFYNLFGLNHTCTLTFVGGFNQQIGLGYEWPNSKFGDGWMGKAKFLYSRNHEVWLKTENNQVVFYQIEPLYAQQLTSGSLKLSKKLSYENSVEIGNTIDFYRIDPSVFYQNPDYLGGDNELTMNTLNVGYVYDSRNQKHYPTSGNELKMGIDFQQLTSRNTDLHFVETVYLKLRKFKELLPKTSMGFLISGQYKFGKLNYLQNRQLGYNGEYVRGYEQYVLDGAGFFLTKISVRYKLMDKKLKFQSKNKLNNYSTAPLSIWFTIFNDNGRILTPYKNPDFLGNTLQTEWLNSVGFSIDVLAYYDLLTRFDVTRNHFGNWIFNLSFKHAI